MIFNLNGGRYKEVQPLKKEYFNQLFQPTVEVEKGSQVGLSWFINQTANGAMILHDGKDLGYTALMVMFEQPKIGIVILSNYQETDCNELLNRLLKVIRF
jgi:hypothetical protein